MNIIIRKLEKTDHEYFAYMKDVFGKATYLLYFEDNIYGAVILNNFIEMLKSYFKLDKVKIIINDHDISLKNKEILKIIAE